MKYLLIHIPKTGGSTIVRNAELKKCVCQPNHRLLSHQYRTALKSEKQQHDVGHSRLQDLDFDNCGSYIKFAVIRNPWSRLVSQFRFTRKMMREKKQTRPDMDLNTTFEQFLQLRNDNYNLKYNWHRTTTNFQQQLDYVSVDGVIMCDLLRFEYYDEDIMQYLHLMKPLPPRNVTSVEPVNYQTFYTNETKEQVANWFRDDIDRFGFTFDGTATKNIWNTQ